MGRPRVGRCRHARNAMKTRQNNGGKREMSFWPGVPSRLHTNHLFAPIGDGNMALTKPLQCKVILIRLLDCSLCLCEDRITEFNLGFGHREVMFKLAFHSAHNIMNFVRHVHFPLGIHRFANVKLPFKQCCLNNNINNNIYYDETFGNTFMMDPID